MMEGSGTSSGFEKLYIYGTYPRFGSGGGEDCIVGAPTRWPVWDSGPSPALRHLLRWIRTMRENGS